MCLCCRRRSYRCPMKTDHTARVFVKVTLILFAPLFYAIAVFLFEFIVLGEARVIWLTNTTWAIFRLTSISRAYSETNDVGFLYYWVFWLINSISLLAIAIFVLRKSLQGKFAYPTSSKQTNRTSIFFTMVFLFFYFGLTAIYSQIMGGLKLGFQLTSWALFSTY